MRIPVVLFSLAVSSSLYANQIYVSPSGSDSNSGASPEQALRSIAAALPLAAPGDEILLLPGTYPGGTEIRDIHGAPRFAITIRSEAADSAEFAVVDGGSAPGNDLDHHGFDIFSCSWLTLRNLKFRNCWTDVVALFDASYISFAGCDFKGGRRVIYPQGSGCHHILVENCLWEQHEGVWTTFDWDEMHHGTMAYYNGALLHPSGTSGSYVMRKNTIANVFNAFRTKPEAYDEDGNGEHHRPSSGAAWPHYRHHVCRRCLR